MTLHKWALLESNRVAQKAIKPASALKRIVKPTQVPKDYKTQYVMRPYIKDSHVDRVQYIENRGMYKHELDIERSRFPKLQKSLLLMTDGSLDEREFECLAAPVTILFYDRMHAHKMRQQQLIKAGVSGKVKEFLNEDVKDPTDEPLCNMLAFPFATPKPTIVRKAQRDVLASGLGDDDDDMQ